MTKRGLATSVLGCSLLAAGTASAQADSPQWLTDRRYAEGAGVRAGDLELHPGIATELGYDSNYFMRSTQAGVDNGPNTGNPLVAPAPIIPALELRVTPSLYVETLGAQRRQDEGSATGPDVAFRAGVNATYRAFKGLTSDANLSNSDIAGNDNVSGEADARLDILPGRPVNGAIFGTYARTILPNTIDADPNISFNQDSIGAGAEVGIQPGSGMLDWHLGYQFATTLFEQSEGQPYSNLSNQVYTRGRWKFRPRTALIYDASLNFFSYTNPDEARSQGLVSSTPVRARIGMNGLITERFGVLAVVGWGASFFDDKIPQVQQFDSVIGQAELKWYLAASPGIAKATDVGLTLSAISLGFSRDFQNSYLGNFDILDRGYLKFDYLFAGRFALQIQGGVGAVQYPTLYWLDPDPTSGLLTAYERGPAFTDVVADASVFGEYRFTNTFGLNATFRYTQTFSDTTVSDVDMHSPLYQPPNVPPTPTVYGMAWERFEAFIGIRLFM